MSTTGDGEPPDNALQFVRRIKKKTLPTDHYKHLSYALLGKSYHESLMQLLFEVGLSIWGTWFAKRALVNHYNADHCSTVFTLRTVAGLRNLHLFSSVCSSFRRHELCKFLQLWKDNWATSTRTRSQTVLCDGICRWWCRVGAVKKQKSINIQLSLPYLHCSVSSCGLCSLQAGGGSGPLARRTVESNQRCLIKNGFW